jgi:hypothetical protein
MDLVARRVLKAADGLLRDAEKTGEFALCERVLAPQKNKFRDHIDKCYAAAQRTTVSIFTGASFGIKTSRQTSVPSRLRLFSRASRGINPVALRGRRPLVPIACSNLRNPVALARADDINSAALASRKSELRAEDVTD